MKRKKYKRPRGVFNGEGVITASVDLNTGKKIYFQNGRQVRLPIGRPCSGRNRIPQGILGRYIQPASMER